MLTLVLAQQESWTREQILRKLSLNERQLRQWEKHGFIPVRENYDFREISALRTLAALTQKAVPLSRIKQAFEALRGKESGVQNPFADLKIQQESGRLRVRMAGRTMEAISGQFLLEFDGGQQSSVRTMPVLPKLVNPAEESRRYREADEWFQKGLDLEQAGGPIHEAIAAYKRVVDLNPQAAGAWVNLGTIHFHLAEWLESEKFYAKAIEVDPNYALAQFNMGNLLEERGKLEPALGYYETALRLNPNYSDAHYNIALLYQALNQPMKALRHWNAYLKLDNTSKWAKVAKRELERLKQQSIVKPAKNLKARKTFSGSA